MLAVTHYRLQEKDIDVHYSVTEKLCRDIDASTELTDEEKDTIKQYMSALPKGKKLCHFDYHPGNIMMREGRPIVIDWMTACTGNPNADVARTMLLLQMGEMMHISPIVQFVLHAFMKRIGKIYFKEYRRLTGVMPEDILCWTLPVAAARLAEWLTEHERAKLVAFVRGQIKTL